MGQVYTNDGSTGDTSREGGESDTSDTVAVESGNGDGESTSDAGTSGTSGVIDDK